MRFIEVHELNSIGDKLPMAINTELVESISSNCGQAVFNFRGGAALAVRESYAEVMALVRGTATAEQATAERHLERIDGLNDSRAVTINDLYDKVESLRQRQDALAMTQARQREAIEKRLTDLSDKVERLGNGLLEMTQAAVDIAVLEDSIGGVSKRQRETYSDVCGLAERIKRLENERESAGALTVPCDACEGLGAQNWESGVVGGVKQEITIACDTCHGSGRVPA